MKVDVTTPDDELDAAAETPQTPTPDPTSVPDPAVDPEPEPEPQQSGEEEVLDAEYEPVEPSSKKKAKASDEVFSMADIENAKAEAQAANDRYMRLQAEWDNFRKRTAREREEEKTRASEALVMKLLPVVDDMERSLDHAAKSAPEGEFGEFVQGVRAVYDKLVDALARTGVEAIDPAGQEFDLNEHQAVAHIEDAELPANTVRDVYQKGYRMGGRVIRPAMVTVSKGGPAREMGSPEESEPAAEE